MDKKLNRRKGGDTRRKKRKEKRNQINMQMKV
jgi:hypothetical protein